MSIQIAPSLLSADFGRLAEETRAVELAGADLIHIDVMDGNFVPNITIGPTVVSAIRRATTLPLDVHLMIVEPQRYIDDFVRAGADIIYVHAEACVHLHRVVQQIRAAGKRAGVSLNPHTSIDVIDVVLPQLSSVLVMTVNPGFGGQAFIPETLPKIRKLRAEIDRRGLAVAISVDGGIGPDTAATVAEAGAEILVAGSAIFRTPDYRASVAAMRAAGAAGAAKRVGATG